MLQSIVGDSVVVCTSDVIITESTANILIGMAMFPGLGARLEDVHITHSACLRLRKYVVRQRKLFDADKRAVCGFGQTVYFARGQKYHSAFAPALVRWNGSLFSLSLATNVVVTALVALRAWCVAFSTPRGQYEAKPTSPGICSV